MLASFSVVFGNASFRTFHGGSILSTHGGVRVPFLGFLGCLCKDYFQ